MVKAHGLLGEVVILPETDDQSRFKKGGVVFVDDGRALTVKSNKPGDRGFLVGFQEVTDRNGAEDFVGHELFVESAERRSLDANEFWPDQLVGLEVRDRTGVEIGRVTQVDDSTSQARLVIATSRGEVEVPFVDELVPEVNLDDSYLVVAPLPGLLD